MNVAEKPVVFNCGDDELVGIIHQPDKPTKTGLILVVGGPQYRVGSHRQFVLLARYLAKNGVTVFRFDYRGMGDSSGELRTFESIREDLKATISFFKTSYRKIENFVLWGLCDAATANVFYACNDPDIHGLILLNPWIRTESGEAGAYIKRYYSSQIINLDFWKRLINGEVAITKSMLSFLSIIKKYKSKNTENVGDDESLPVRFLQGIKKYRGKVLIVLSGNDITAAEFKNQVAMNKDLKRELAKTSVTTINIKEANHTFSSKDWRSLVEELTFEWISDNFELS
ncbi:MAG: hydrolase 1, exosortase A system-associated [Gammaproteobacteria bacterium]|nr:hydrolase 1, exosortase A system-associated [Gammaproteobacteria bacterium]